MTTHTPDTPTPVLITSEERMWRVIAHLSGLLAFVGPLVVYLVQQHRSAAVTREAKESLNFQISIAIYFLAVMIAGTALTFAVVGVFLLMLAPIIPLAGAILSIVGGVKANASGAFRYPVTVRFVR